MPIRIFTLGSNSSGQLGIGHFEDVSSPEQCVIPDLADDDNDDVVKQIVAGGNHTLVLTERGKVFAAGNGSDGRCGALVSACEDGKEGQVRNDEKERFSCFSLVHFGTERSVGETRITHIAATWEASFFVVDGKKVYGCGTGMKGELGLGREVLTASEQTLVFDVDGFEGHLVSIKDIAANMGHLVLTTSNGNVYGWGGCRKGQLGDGLKAEKIVWRPTKLNIPFQVSRAVVGRDYTLVIGERMEIKLLGDRKHFSETLEPDLIGADRYIVSGWSSIYALSQGRLRVVGRNDRGQVLPPDLPLIAGIAAGSEHVIACSQNGDILAWGWGEHGNCGKPVDDRGNVFGRVNHVSLELLPGEAVGLLAGGCATSFIVLQSKP